MSLSARTWALETYTSTDGTPLKPLERLLLIVLADREHPTKGYAYPGFDDLSRRTGSSKSTIIRTIKSLETAGLLRVEHTNGGAPKTTNKYFLIGIPDVVRQRDPEWARAHRVAVAPKLELVAD